MSGGDFFGTWKVLDLNRGDIIFNILEIHLSFLFILKYVSQNLKITPLWLPK